MKKSIQMILTLLAVAIMLTGTLILLEDTGLDWLFEGNEVIKSTKDSEETVVIGGEETLYIQIIDVGQADAVLFHAGGETMLIDAGDSKTSGWLVDYIASLGIERIDYLIATHPHADHIGGMHKIVDYFDIGEIYMPKRAHNTRTYEELLVTIQNKGNKVKTGEHGVSFTLGESVQVELLAPLHLEYNNLNDVSIVTKVTNNQDVFLFTGDAEEEAEEDILHANIDVRADVLKLGHHGSRTSSTLEFIEAVDPDYALISAGVDNRYGHPHEETLEMLERYNIPYYNTATSGTITIVSTGNGYTIYTEK